MRDKNGKDKNTFRLVVRKSVTFPLRASFDIRVFAAPYYILYLGMSVQYLCLEELLGGSWPQDSPFCLRPPYWAGIFENEDEAGYFVATAKIIGKHLKNNRVNTFNFFLLFFI